MSELVDGDGRPAALQIGLTDGSSVVCTVWTDWSLLLEWRPDSGVPDYLWPPEAFSREPLVADIPEGGIEVISIALENDEVGIPVQARIELEGCVLDVQSIGGEIDVSVAPDGSRG
ncbi:hypothetical protein AB0L34_24270 [Micromonospora sp. NPDC052213]|uniref:hypothetical protein n=1 Tax=Micromonospora sp. NPDC052213 TaxID=3155812 RepID=UPI0034423B50